MRSDITRYSPLFTPSERGLLAASMEDNTPHEVIQKRFDRLVDIVQAHAFEKNQLDLGATIPVLVEAHQSATNCLLQVKSPKNQTYMRRFLPAKHPNNWLEASSTFESTKQKPGIWPAISLNNASKAAATVNAAAAALLQPVICVVGPTASGKTDVAQLMQRVWTGKW